MFKKLSCLCILKMGEGRGQGWGGISKIEKVREINGRKERKGRERGKNNRKQGNDIKQYFMLYQGRVKRWEK